MPFKLIQSALFLLLSLFCQSLFAANIDWRYCGPSQFKIVKNPVTPLLEFSGEITIEADNITATDRETLDLFGAVKFKNAAGTVDAEEARYQVSLQKLTTKKGIRFETDYLITIGDNADLDLAQRKGTIDNTQFWLPRSHMRGTAERLTMVDKKTTRLDKAFFTSCLEGVNDWELRSSELTLNKEKNEGVAKHARLWFKNVPIFYFPYVSFSLEGRKTGLLTPAIGNSNKNGRHITLPYYINIAPNLDATVTPVFYQKRGVLLRTEHRFLFPTTSGILNFDYLNDDKIDGDNRSNKRFYGDFKIRSFPAKGWRTSLDFRTVSDDSYLSDFGDSYLQANESYLERKVDLAYLGEQWEFIAAMQGYQTTGSEIKPFELPYQQLPKLNINFREKIAGPGIHYKLDMGLVSYEREAGVIGRRIDIAPRISRPFEKSGGYIKPALTLRYTKYSLDRVGKTYNLDTDTFEDIDAQPDRSIPQWSLDSGLFLEKDVQIGGERHITTLEPRIYYLYVPFRDQQDMIVEQVGQDLYKETTFDAGQPQLTYSQLFRENRFNGIDKIGDANQITLALSSKLITNKGLERLRVSVGQIRYLQDRRVSLPSGDTFGPTKVGSGPTLDTDVQSDLVVELSSRWNRRIDAQAVYVWGAADSLTQSSHYRFRYRHDKNTMFNINYRYETGVEEQADTTILGKIHAQWKGLAHFRYSLRNNQRLETFIGVEYESCCWAFRFLQREYLTEDGITRNNSTWLQLELKGLTKVGNKLRSVFRNGTLSNSY